MDLDIFYNRYRTLKKIGEGGLGTVFLAEDTWNGRKVALKLLDSPKTSVFLKRLFQKEFKLLQNLKHPGLPQVYDFFVSQTGKVGYTLEFVPGEPFLAEKKVLDLKTFYPLALQICQILDFIHAHKIIHRDLKPQNFLVSGAVKSKTEAHFGIKLIDFGLASSHLEKDKNVKGTLGYISPEILKGEGFDQRADLYSLGVIFYQALTGKLPFDYADPALLMAAQLEQKPLPPHKYNSKIPLELSQLILKLLEVNPENRISDISLVQATLDKLSRSKIHETYFTAYLESGRAVGLAGPLRFFRQNLKKPDFNLCLISGEKGVGKTTLLREMKFLAQSAGYLTLEIKAVPRKPASEKLLESVKSIYNYL
ncbi:MAG: serine/threonine-protein kinase, partial [candidate division Zixibacteria bacterium]|nr:serine/threonine-protein kinase [candidate division Zixibacteria bacterium]